MTQRLLVVDDDSVDREIIRRSLKGSMLNTELLEARDGQSGLAMLENERVDCILLDYRLPDIDGLSFLEELNKQRDIGCLAVVMLTGEGNEAIAVEAMKRGASDYVVKDDLSPLMLERTVIQAINLVTARKDRQIANDRYFDLFENAHDLIQGVAPDGSLLYANRAWREAMGYRIDEIENLSIRDTLHPSSFQHCKDHFEQLINGETSDRLEAKFVTKDGRTLFAEGSTNCCIEDGQPSTIRGIFQNITARKQMEDVLHLRTAAAEAATDGILISDARLPDFPIVYASPAFLTLTGYIEEEVIGRNCRFLQGVETDPHVAKQIAESLLKGSSFQGELVNYRKNGERFWNLVRMEPLGDADGGVKYIVATQTDITARKEMEQALSTEKERLQITLQSIGDGVFTTDATGRIVFMNPIAEKLTGWNLQEAVGRSLEEVFRIVNESTYEPSVSPIERCIQSDGIVGFDSPTLLISRNGNHYGVQDSAAPIRDEKGNILGVVLVFQDVTEQRSLVKQIEYQAQHDALTGLLNRREFELRLTRALENSRSEGSQHALCFLDLDNFKIVNDTAGHIAGDALLKQISHLLSKKLRDRDSLARLGGDEFSLLLESCSFAKAYEIAESLVELIHNMRFAWEDRIYHIGVSIGIVPITADETTVTTLLTQADIACYAAKRQGRNRVVAYHAENGDSARHYREMLRATSLRDALEKDRFQLYGQFITPLDENSDLPRHVEILLRLEDESGELLLPGAFIAAAERYQMMDEIDRWVIRNALQQYQWIFGLQSKIGITINLSGNSFTDEGLLSFVKEQIELSNVPPELICFEITETAAISNLTHAIRFMNELKRIGCCFALDDFGSGLSSFSYLKQFPVDYLKIDGTFVKTIATDSVNRAMVESINNVGHIMGIKTIAEWAEDEAVLEELLAIGVDYVQGYVVGHPTPLSNLQI